MHATLTTVMIICCSCWTAVVTESLVHVSDEVSFLFCCSLRTSETNYLNESYAFYSAIRMRGYYSKANKEERCVFLLHMYGMFL